MVRGGGGEGEFWGEPYFGRPPILVVFFLGFAAFLERHEFCWDQKAHGRGSWRMEGKYAEFNDLPVLLNHVARSSDPTKIPWLYVAAS